MDEEEVREGDHCSGTPDREAMWASDQVGEKGREVGFEVGARSVEKDVFGDQASDAVSDENENEK